MTEGPVRLDSPTPRRNWQSTTFLPAGSVAKSTPDSTSLRFGTPPRPSALVAQRRPPFRDTPLAAAAASSTAMAGKRIEMGDARVAALRVGGNFSWANADGFVRLLEAWFPGPAEHGAIASSCITTSEAAGGIDPAQAIARHGFQ